MTSWQGASCQSPWDVRALDYASFVQDKDIVPESPIDNFYKSSREFITLSTPELLSQNRKLGGLLLVGLISTTENYFREVFSHIIQICPCSQRASADASVKLGSMLWHKDKPLSRGAFEHLSFADGKAISTACKKYLDIELKKNDPLSPQPLIEEFDRLCNLRHGIVHSDSFLPGNNALALSFNQNNGSCIEIDQQMLHAAAEVCLALVVAFNKFLFVRISERWARVWGNHFPNYLESRNKHFKAFWIIFRSQYDSANGSLEGDCGMVRCRNLIMKEHGM